MIYYSEDFGSPLFQTAFKAYFSELGIEINDWEGLFQAMQAEGGNFMYVAEEDSQLIGFLMSKWDELSNWFFIERVGFVREFWVDPSHRGKHLGQQLLSNTEQHFLDAGIYKIILTTDRAASFYATLGYQLDKSYQAKNEDPVYTKLLKENV